MEQEEPLFADVDTAGFYSEDHVEDLAEEDELSIEEEGFMEGYIRTCAL